MSGTGRCTGNWYYLALLLLAISSVAWGAPKNVILLIGDGMGFAHVAAARMTNGNLAMDSMPVAASVNTSSANALVTDSAAAGTALACGVKTNNGMVGVTPDRGRLKSILEAARGIGKATGLVTTTSVTDATPASFAGHVDARSKHTEIAGQLLANRVDVLLGGGMGFFVPKSVDGGARTDGRDLISEAKARGYALLANGDDLQNASGQRVLGLFAMGNLTTEAPEPPLSALAEKAIRTLSQDKDGFFLMIEGGKIDSSAHANDLDGMIRQLVEFDNAAARALDFARQDGKTLVIVTADHETGGLTLLTDENGKLKPAWSTKGHSGVTVPLYASGPDAERFSGFIDNTQVGLTIASIWGVAIGE